MVYCSMLSSVTFQKGIQCSGFRSQLSSRSKMHSFICVQLQNMARLFQLAELTNHNWNSTLGVLELRTKLSPSLIKQEAGQGEQAHISQKEFSNASNYVTHSPNEVFLTCVCVFLSFGLQSCLSMICFCVKTTTMDGLFAAFWIPLAVSLASAGNFCLWPTRQKNVMRVRKVL